MLSLNFAPANPQLNARSRMISFESAADSHNKYQSRFKEWLQMSTVEFGLCRLPKNQGDIFMCTAIDKAGIEGNPPKVWIAKNIDDWFYEQSARPKETDLEPETEKAYGEHSFIGFTKADNMSKCAQKMQLFACNILKNGVLNALSQSKNKFTPLPSTKALAVETRRQQYEFAKSYLTGYQLGARMLLSNQKKLSQYIRWHQNNRIKLG